YAAGAIVAWRIVWGFVGPDNARFSNFITGPQTSLRYLLGLLRGHSRRYLGHSPAGGAMIIALLLFIAATVITGLLADKDTENAAAASGPVVISQAYARDEGSASTSRGREKSESFVGELHDVLANITLGLVVFHLLGVALASFVHRENLVEAMITGKKRPDLS
ncbi:MAG TPA: cytochrome b/b6 domain-containing protein, partial [Hyphomicrobiales bacterium]|nr:cytochrome b/b6 domain-containing protein [Hyphomicrobiales bacterium]